MSGGRGVRPSSCAGQAHSSSYKPLLAELLVELGSAQASIDDDPSKGEATLREAIIAAEASRDDVTAAKVSANLVYVVGYQLGRQTEAEFWAGLGHAILDRIGGDHARLRSWLFGNLGGARERSGDFDGARALLEKSLVLKEQSLGKTHPDVAVSLSALAFLLTEMGHAADALAAANRAIEVFSTHGDPEAFALGFTYSNQGDALNALGRYSEAEKAYENALQILSKNVGAMHTEVAFAFNGLGQTKLAQGTPAAAVRLFEEALRIRRQPHVDPALAADSEFGLAHALWKSGGDRTRARSLATAALTAYQDGRRTEREHAVETWLATHSPASSRPPTVR